MTSPAGIVKGSLYSLASLILAPGGIALYNEGNGLPEDLLGTSTNHCLIFSQIPTGLEVYFLHTGTGPPAMMSLLLKGFGY